MFIFRITTVSRKPFHKIYSEISNPEISYNEKIILIKGLHEYLNDYLKEQILFDNLEFYKKESIFWYDIFFTVSFCLIFFLSLRLNISDAAKVFLIFSTNTIIVVIAMYTIDFFQFRQLAIYDKKRNGSVYNIASLAKNNALIIVNSLIIFSLFLASFTLFSVRLINMESTIHLFNLMISEIRTYDVESINGNRFSLSQLFFTLAISGTVIFSIISSHLKQQGKINDKLYKQISIYGQWFEENEKFVSVKLEEIFNKNALIDFYNAVDALSIKLGVNDFKRLKAPIQRFYSIVVLIIISYFTAIFTVIAPSRFMNYLFLIFTICCGSFIFYAYRIFKDYSN